MQPDGYQVTHLFTFLSLHGAISHVQGFFRVLTTMPFFMGFRLSLVFLWICSFLYASGAASRELQRRASSFAIVGAPVINGNVPRRLEIRELRKNTAQWNLYLLAMNELQRMDKSEVKSYYQLSGIHGRPFVEWDGVPLSQDTGYCAHTSNLFATWHRPLIVAFEQVLYDLVQETASGIEGDTTGEYKSAAATFRHPYWDWAAPSSEGPVLPAPISGSAYINVNLPNGTHTINNPLYQFAFAASDLASFPDKPFNIWRQTMRYPSSKTNAAQSQDSQVSQQIQASQDSYAQRFMILLKNYPHFANFSTSAWTPNAAGYDSLESLHNQVHGLIGNGGHMAVVDYAGFDPLFWLHHTQVDRLLAIWQAIYRDDWVGASEEPEGSATIAQGARTDASTPLKPFHKDTQGTFWTSDGVRNIGNLGYSYPETHGKTPSEVKAAVNALYSDSSGEILSRRSGHHGRSSSVAPLVAAGIANAAAAEPVSGPKSGTYTEWIANIRVAKDALEQTFFIHIFLGEFNPDPAVWTVEPNLVGTHSIITPYVMKRDPRKRTIVTGTIPLTRALRADSQRGLVNLQDEDAVKTYLTRNLHWRITTVRCLLR